MATRTDFLGLSMSVVLQLAEEGVLLGQQHFNVLHTHSDYSGADVRLKTVDTLVGERRDVLGKPCADITNPDSLQLHGALI